MGSKVKVDCSCQHNGIWTVRDRMHTRWKSRIDFLIHPNQGLGVWNNVKIKLYAKSTRRT